MSFFQATSDNLPLMDLDMVLGYLQKNPATTESKKQMKKNKSSKSKYGDDSFGWVELKRDGPLCEVKAQITPEPSLRTDPYKVSTTINESKEEVVSCTCQDCPESKGRCEHACALIFWLHRRSEEPTPSEEICYWRKSPILLAENVKFATLADLFKDKMTDLPPPKWDMLEEAREFFPPGTRNLLTLNWEDTPPLEKMGLYHLMLEYKETKQVNSADNFLKFCSERMTPELCLAVEETTRNEEAADSKLWAELHYGRVTESTMWPSTRKRCTGTLIVDTILGGWKPQLRGRKVQDQITKLLSELLDAPLSKCGVLINSEYPFLSATPDAIADNYVVEVKSPNNRDTVKKYLNDGELKNRVSAEMQLYMLMSGKESGLLAVLDPSSDNKELSLKWVTYDPVLAAELVAGAKEFWSKFIFKELFNI